VAEPNRLDVAGAKKVPQRNLQRESRRLIMGGFCFFVPCLAQLLAKRRMGVFGEKLQLITKQCCVCKKMVALRVDPEDIARYERGVFAQNALVRRDGKPYLTPAERELFLSECCEDCWRLLCPDDELAYN